MVAESRKAQISASVLRILEIDTEENEGPVNGMHGEDAGLLVIFRTDLYTRLRVNDITQATLDGYLVTVTTYCRFLYDSGLPSSANVNTRDIEAWFVALADGTGSRSGKKLKPHSLLHYWVTLKQYYKWLADDDQHRPGGSPLGDRRNPYDKVKKPKAERVRKDIVEKQDLSDTLHMLEKTKAKTPTTARRRLRDLVALSLTYDTAMRASQLANLKTEDIDLDNGAVHLRPVSGSKRREHWVAIGDGTVRFIARYLHTFNGKLPEYLLTGNRFERGKPKKMTGNGVYQVIRAIFERTGEERLIGPHDLRHSFATHASRSGPGHLDDTDLRVHMGHSKLETTDGYRADAMEENAMDAHRLRRAGVDGLPPPRGRKRS